MTLLAFLFGLLIGSFLNVCIHRWPAERSVVRPRSRCPRCGAAIAWYDNVPLLSFVLLRGRCRRCQRPISWRYPAVELLNALLYAGLTWKFGLQPFTWKAALFGSMMLVLIFSDLEQFILPDEVTLGGLGLGLALSLVVAVPPGPTGLIWALLDAAPRARLASLAESLAGVVFFGGMLWALREVYYRVRGADGLGLGDVKMAAMIGAFWGVPFTLVILIAGSVAGAMIGTVIVLVGRKRWSHELPFGSYLGAAGIAVVFWGEEIFEAYWKALEGLGVAT